MGKGKEEAVKLDCLQPTGLLVLGGLCGAGLSDFVLEISLLSRAREEVSRLLTLIDIAHLSLSTSLGGFCRGGCEVYWSTRVSP